MRTPGFSRCEVEALNRAFACCPSPRTVRRPEEGKPANMGTLTRPTSHVKALHAKHPHRARNPITSTHSPCWMATAKAPGSSSRQGHQAHARVVRVVDPCAPGSLHPKRVRKSNRERRYLAFFEIIGQSPPSRSAWQYVVSGASSLKRRYVPTAAA